MNILDVTEVSHEAGIEFANIESVKAALRIFANGIPGSGETMRQGFDSGPDGGFGLAVKLIMDNRLDSGFMADLLGGVDSVTPEMGYTRSYDYDGEGLFFKSTVEISAVEFGQSDDVSPKLVYILRLSAAYVGDKPTANLAEVLGARRALSSDEVSIKVAPVGDCFEIDFNDIATRLETIGLTTMSGEEIASSVMKQVGDYESRSWARFEQDGTLVSLGINELSVGRAIDYRTGEITWKQAGALVTGPLRPGFGEGAPLETPKISVRIEKAPQDGDPSWTRKPIVDPAVKRNVHIMAATIADAF